MADWHSGEPVLAGCVPGPLDLMSGGLLCWFPVLCDSCAPCSLHHNTAVAITYSCALSPAKVTLAVPWLSSQEQAGLFPDSLVFHRPDEQEAYIKKVWSGEVLLMRRSHA